MSDIKCECGKILCQSDHEYIVIKCRHCKRFIFIKKEDHCIPNPHFTNKSGSHHFTSVKHA